jgi:hypothetical protein
VDIRVLQILLYICEALCARAGLVVLALSFYNTNTVTLPVSAVITSSLPTLLRETLGF